MNENRTFNLMVCVAKEWDRVCRIDKALEEYLGVLGSGDLLYRLLRSRMDCGQPLTELPVLIGPPGCGKSRFIDAFMLHEIQFPADPMELKRRDFNALHGDVGATITPDAIDPKYLDKISVYQCRPELATKSIDELEECWFQLCAEAAARLLREMEK